MKLAGETLPATSDSAAAPIVVRKVGVAQSMYGTTVPFCTRSSQPWVAWAEAGLRCALATSFSSPGASDAGTWPLAIQAASAAGLVMKLTYWAASLGCGDLAGMDHGRSPLAIAATLPPAVSGNGIISNFLFLAADP